MRLEGKLDGAGRSVALFADDNFSAVLGGLHVRLPFEPFLRAFTRLFILQVILLAEHEQHHVGVLLDRTGFAEIGELRALVVTRLDLARKLR